jgi:hypothetical protein
MSVGLLFLAIGAWVAGSIVLEDIGSGYGTPTQP